MICPHCGMNTGNSEKCVHCSGATEFVRRTKIRPERIPNLNDLNLNSLVQSTPKLLANGIILIIAVIITSLAVASSIFSQLNRDNFFRLGTMWRSSQRRA